ncbi:hypothetical protein [Nostoc sp.]
MLSPLYKRSPFLLNSFVGAIADSQSTSHKRSLLRLNLGVGASASLQ